jgi:hypothetical protein
MERSTVQSCLAAPVFSIKSVVPQVDISRLAISLGTCTQNKARNGVHFRAKSAQSVRLAFFAIRAIKREQSARM